MKTVKLAVHWTNIILEMKTFLHFLNWKYLRWFPSSCRADCCSKCLLQTLFAIWSEPSLWIIQLLLSQFEMFCLGLLWLFRCEGTEGRWWRCEREEQNQGHLWWQWAHQSHIYILEGKTGGAPLVLQPQDHRTTGPQYHNDIIIMQRISDSFSPVASVLAITARWILTLY